MSLLELDLGMRSVIAADCILPWVKLAVAGADGSTTALAFRPEEDSALATEDDGTVTPAGTAGDAAGADETADVFDCTVRSGTNDAIEYRKYHAPPAAAAIKPAATPIQIPLPPPLRLLTSGALSLSSEFPNNGVAGVYFGVPLTLFAGAAAFCEEAASGAAGGCHSSNWLSG